MKHLHGAVWIGILFEMPGLCHAQSIGIVNNEQFDGPTALEAVPGNKPADNSIAVSGEGVAIAMNELVVYYDRNDVPIGGPDDLVGLGPFFGESEAFDPRVIYDVEADRFVICSLTGTQMAIAWADEGMPLPLGDPNN